MKHLLDSRALLAVALIVTGMFAASCATTAPPPPALDLKITNARIVDGTGAPWYRGDIGVRGNTIVDIGQLSALTARQTIDAADKVVSPGFIDLLGQDQGSVIADPHLEPKVRQGVTTEVTGEGHSPGPVKAEPAAEGRRPRWLTLGQYLDAVDKQGSAVNIALLVGASNPREMVIGDVNRQPTPEEMKQMEAIVDQAMRDGAIGISTSLIYLPAMFSSTEEIIALAKVAAKYHGMYFTHMRSEADEIDKALDETFRIGREANLPVNIWHLKIGPMANWGKMPHVIDRILAARSEGLDVAANVYPYVASGTSLSTLAPDWALEGGYKDFQQRLQNSETREKIFEEFRHQFERRGANAIYVARIPNPALSQYEKKFVEEIAAMMGTTREEALARLFLETTGSPSVIFYTMREDDVQYALRQPFVSIGSDSGAPSPQARANNAYVHPRAYGTFPRVAGHYVRDEKLLTLEEAVRKMTSQAADRANMHDRGILRPGMKADIVVFDPEKIADMATFANPNQFSVGVVDVIVNGVPVLRDGVMTDALPGKTIRGEGYVTKR